MICILKNKTKLVKYDKEFLNLSWEWLNDPEIKELTMTPKITREMQKEWFDKLNDLDDYEIFGVQYDEKKIGAVGLKNIKYNNSAEYWGYIGNKEYWGHGIGSILIQEMEKRAREIGIKQIYLKVINFNLRAIKLYRSHGFVVNQNNNGVLIMIKDVV